MTELTSAQRSLWFAHTLEPSTPFVIAQYVELNGRLDPDRLECAAVIAHREFGADGLHIHVSDGVPELREDPQLSLIGERQDFHRVDDPDAAAGAWMDDDWSTATLETGRPLALATLLLVGTDRWFWYYRAHHIALDGYSAALLMRRTVEIYLSPGPLDVRSTEIRDTDRGRDNAVIAEQERRYRASDRYIRDRDFWRAQLAATPSAPTLGTPGLDLGPRRTVRATGTIALSQLSATDAVAAFATYVARLSDGDDVCLSLPVSARLTAASKSAVGAMSNVIPLLLRGIGSAPPADAASAVDSALGQALRHQLFRREEIAQLTDTRGQPVVRSFGPIVNMMMFDASLTMGEIRGHVEILTTGPVDDLALNVYPSYDGGIRIDLEANGAMYTEDVVEAHHHRFLGFLLRYVRARSGEGQSIPAVWSDHELTARAPARGEPAAAPLSLDTLLRSTVSARRTARALLDGDRSWTYGCLDRQAQAWGDHLRSLGVGHDDVVVVAIPRSAESVLAMWAVARAGATYVPVDPSHPFERLDRILADCRPAIGLTVPSYASALPSSIPWLTLHHPASARHLPVFDAPAPHPDHRAYMIFTSGSTGRPKAVAVVHRGLVNLASDIRALYDLSPHSVVMHCASPSFDTSIVEMLAPALTGASMVICPPHIVGGAELEDLLTRHEVTHLLLTPSSLATISPERVPGLQVVVVGGERLPSALVRRWAASVRLRSAYGPTETTCSVTITDTVNTNDLPTLGYPMRGVYAAVLDTALRPLSTGAAGELYLSGAGLARGYDHRPADTATRFVASGFSPGARMFRTGDRARWTLDGQLEFLGRTDDQVKVRGRRIELGEIDAVLRAHPGVDFATTTTHELSNGSVVLVSYVKLHPAPTTPEKSLERHLRDTLPSYMIPATVVHIERVPLTPNKKVDRAALPAPTFDPGDSAREPTAIESRILDIFHDVLTVTGMGPDDSFFEFGGDSLSATRVSSRVSTEFGAAVGVRDVFESPTAAALAQTLGAHRGTLVPLQRVTDGPIPRLSPAQRWIRREPSSPALYNLPFTIRVHGEWDVDAFDAAIRDVLARHETLRTIYPDIDGAPRPVIVPVEKLPSGIVTHVSGSAGADHAVRESLSRGFDVRTEIPVRVVERTLGPRDHLVAVALHHIAADGWSLAVIARDVSIAYRSRVRNDAPTWTPIEIRYSDYAHWRWNVLGDDATPSELATRQRHFWAVALAGAPAELALPVDHARPAEWTYRAERVACVLDAGIQETLARYAHDAGTGTFTMMHAIVVATLSTLTGDHDIVIGTPVAGRGSRELDQVVGTFVNTVALRTVVDVTSTFRSLVAECRDGELSAYDNSDVPFEQLIELLDPPRNSSVHPFFQVAMSFENFPSATLDAENVTFEVTPQPLDIAKCDLHFHFADRRDGTGAAAGIDIALVYAADLFDEATGALFLKTLCTTAEMFASAPESQITTLAATVPPSS